MSAKRLKELLLEPWTAGTSALFSKQSEIVRAITTSRPNSRYVGRERSLTTFLSQIVNGERSCPHELQDDIVAVSLRAADVLRRDHQEMPSNAELEAVLRSALAGDHGRPSSQLVTDLLVRQLRAREVTIVNPSTLEGRGDHPRAHEFQRAMLDAVCDDNTPAQYVFVFDEENLGEKRRHVDQTIRGIKAKLSCSDEDARKKYSELTAGENPRIRIKLVDSDLCIIPLVAFDPGASKYESDVFVWDWARDENGDVTDNIAKLSPQIKDKWLRDFYEPIVCGTNASDVPT